MAYGAFSLYVYLSSFTRTGNLGICKASKMNYVSRTLAEARWNPMGGCKPAQWVPSGLSTCLQRRRQGNHVCSWKSPAHSVLSAMPAQSIDMITSRRPADKSYDPRVQQNTTNRSAAKGLHPLILPPYCTLPSAADGHSSPVRPTPFAVNPPPPWYTLKMILYRCSCELTEA